jgi:hypothetical protein
VNPFRTDNDLRVVLFDLEQETAHLRIVALHIAAPVTESVDEMLDMSMGAMSTDSPVDANVIRSERDKGRARRSRGAKQAMYAARGSR